MTPAERQKIQSVAARSHVLLSDDGLFARHRTRTAHIGGASVGEALHEIGHLALNHGRHTWTEQTRVRDEMRLLRDEVAAWRWAFRVAEREGLKIDLEEAFDLLTSYLEDSAPEVQGIYTPIVLALFGLDGGAKEEEDG